MNEMQKFDTGATRSADTDKPDPEGFFSPLALHAYMLYMHKHRKQSDGTLRASDNWQKGIPLNNYAKSLWRHTFDVWAHHRGLPEIATEAQIESLCATIFNAMGYLHELLKSQRQKLSAEVEQPPTTPLPFTATEAAKIRTGLLIERPAGIHILTTRQREYLEQRWWIDSLHWHFKRTVQEPVGEGENAVYRYSVITWPDVYYL